MCGLPKRRPFHNSELFKLGPSLLIDAATPSRRTGAADANQSCFLLRLGDYNLYCSADDVTNVLRRRRAKSLARRLNARGDNSEQEHRRLVEKWNLWRQLGMTDERAKWAWARRRLATTQHDRCLAKEVGSKQPTIHSPFCPAN